MKMHIVSLRSPWRLIREVEAEIFIGKKMTWAIRPGGRRHLIGSSAFHTEASAGRARLALLTRIAESGYHKAKHYHLWQAAERQLKLLKGTP